MGAPAALVRPQFFSGTHTIACALFGTLRPGDELLALAGHPYDTLEEVIGLRGRQGDGSLAELGVSYREIPLASTGELDWSAIKAGVLRPQTKCVTEPIVPPPSLLTLPCPARQSGAHPAQPGLRHASDADVPRDWAGGGCAEAGAGGHHRHG